jgi:hypothetical protein
VQVQKELVVLQTQLRTWVGQVLLMALYFIWHKTPQIPSSPFTLLFSLSAGFFSLLVLLIRLVRPVISSTSFTIHAWGPPNLPNLTF